VTDRRETWFRLDPLDSVAVRDGRPFDAGGDHAFSAVAPRPSTVTGAVHQVVAGPGFSRDLRFAGPLLVDDSGEALFPWPRDVVEGLWGGLSRLRPTTFDGVTFDDDDLPPLMLDGDGDPVDGWLIRSGDLAAYLGGALDVAALDHVESGWVPELHVGLHRGDGRRAVDGMLYAAEHRRLRPGWRMLVRVQHGADLAATDGRAFLGGERRLAEVSVADGPPVPLCPGEFPGGRVLVYLAALAVFEAGWRPAVPDGAALRAAALSGPVPLATWGKIDQRNSFVLRRAVAEGSVYYLQFASPDAARRWAASVHGQCLPQASTKLRSAGFGWCLTGRWE
jgi:CRISPR type III-B/RAMP module-associated protein Cmr3